MLGDIVESQAKKHTLCFSLLAQRDARQILELQHFLFMKFLIDACYCYWLSQAGMWLKDQTGTFSAVWASSYPSLGPSALHAMNSHVKPCKQCITENLLTMRESQLRKGWYDCSENFFEDLLLGSWKFLLESFKQEQKFNKKTFDKDMRISEDFIGCCLWLWSRGFSSSGCWSGKATRFFYRIFENQVRKNLTIHT